MAFRIRIMVCLCLLPVGAAAAGLATFAGECRMPVVDGWTALSDTGGYPVELLHENYQADFSIFKSAFSEDEAVTTTEDLRAAVEGVLDQVIDELPGSRLLTNTGYYLTRSTGFILEFESSDAEGLSAIRHRMYTALYTQPDGAQVMFTLWAKATQSDYPLVEPSIRYMQENFTYLGEVRDHVFPEPASRRWFWMALLVGLVAMMWLWRSLRQRRAA